MRVLLTGASGFLGAHLLRVLLREGISAAVLLREESNTWRISSLLPQVEVIRGDLKRIPQLQPQLEAFAPDTVIHCAWAGVGNKYRNDPLQINENLQPTLELFRLARRIGCSVFVGLGSQAEYGPLNRRISEHDPTQPSTLYGAVKLATSILLRQMAEQEGVRFVWLRVFSTYGPMDEPGWMIPQVIQALLRKEKPSLTAGEQKWDYLYAGDAAEAIYKAAASPQAKGIFNLGSGRVYTLRQIVETIRDMIDPALLLGFGELPYRPDQVMHLEADISRLEQSLGWRPATALEGGLRETIAWYQTQQEKRT